MAKRKSEAWLTYAVDNDDVQLAIVLAESLRRTRTTRMIAVMTSTTLSTQNRAALGLVFDFVFNIDESLKFRQENGNDFKAKIFAFTLRMFDKCVFLAPQTLVLENVDKLFEDTGYFDHAHIEYNDLNLFESSCFVVSPPSAENWNAFLRDLQKTENATAEMNLWKMLHNHCSMMNHSTNTLTTFSADEGLLLTNQTYAPIIQFVEAKSLSGFPEKLRGFLKMSFIGLAEKIIISTWLEIHEQWTSKMEMAGDSFSSDDYGNTCQNYKQEPITIIGMSCRYPSANSVNEFWELLQKGEEGIGKPPSFRWTNDHTLGIQPKEKTTNAGFLSKPIDVFDAKFFGVSPKEAVYMDPQARLLHEVLWEALEDAGIDPLSLYGTHTGIFTGSWMNDYKEITQGSMEKDFFRTYMGNSIGAAVARLSFLLGVTGPSIATESGCSSAIVALDLAVKSLRLGETSLNLVGGVNLLLHPFTSDIMPFVLSPNGRCRTFDDKADGFGRAEGCGVLVLKRLSDALRDRDNIWAVIRGSAVSQEGLSKSLGTPTVHCEALAMQLALKDGNVLPEQVSFVETHGTGTRVGDPMEVAAIAKAYKSENRRTPLVIGSVKTNVGHTESCSGITGIMKTVLAMKHELIPKHLNLETLNPEIVLDNIPAIIPSNSISWPKIKGQPRIGGVSSFGITGTDGHVIIQDAPDYELPKFNLELERTKHLLKISAKSSEALANLLDDYQNLFTENTKFRDAAFSGNVGRANFNYRAFIVAENSNEAANILKDGKYFKGEVNSNHRKICFLFTGQGSQFQGMSKTLYETCPVFRVNFDRCDKILRDLYNISICQVLWGPSSNDELSRTIYSQTSIFCLEYCLLQLWQSWGVTPDYLLGHSLGEMCAAVAADVLDFKDALKLVAERSQLIDNLPRGGMLVVKAGEPEVKKHLKFAKLDLDIAATNTQEQTVVAGDGDKIEKFKTYLESLGVKAVILQATHAFHSKHMDPMLENYRKIAESIKYKAGNGTTAYISGMEGNIIEDVSELGAEYWVRHARESVSFFKACTTLQETDCQDFLEIGPQQILSSFLQINNENIKINCFPSLKRSADDWDTMLTSLGKLYLHGYNINWKAYDEPYLRKKVSIPFHPFHPKSYWVEKTSSNFNSNFDRIHPLVGSSISNASSSLNIFQNHLNTNLVPFLKDHQIGNRTVFPGAGYIEMCLAALHFVVHGVTENLEGRYCPVKLENLRIKAPLEFKNGKGVTIQTIVDLENSVTNLEKNYQSSGNSKGFRIKIYNQNNCQSESGKWILHASSTLFPFAFTNDAMNYWKPDKIKEMITLNNPISPNKFYTAVANTGLKFGESFRMLKRYWTNVLKGSGSCIDEVIAEMEIPADYKNYLIHPLILDAVFQSVILTTNWAKDLTCKVPIRIGRLTVLRRLELENEKNIYIHVKLEGNENRAFIATKNMTPIAFIEQVELVDTNVRTIESILDQQSNPIPDAWEETWKIIESPFNQMMENSVNFESIFSEMEILEQFRILGETSEMDLGFYLKTERLLDLYILNALFELGWTPKLGQLVTPESLCTELKILPEFFRLVFFYLTFLSKTEEHGFIVKINSESDTWRIRATPPTLNSIKTESQNLYNDLKDTKVSVVTQIYEQISKMLSKVLRGKQSMLEFLFPSGNENESKLSADAFYANHPGDKPIMSVAELGCTTIFKTCYASRESKGVYRVLEVGSGTGSLTRNLLKWLKNCWEDKFELYFTDLSQTFFVKAEKKFENFRQNLRYQVFNIEQSPLSQGIPLQYFDMVASSNVLHATRDLQQTLIHLRQTLKPGGILCFIETVVPAKDYTFVFGLLEGYWRFRDFQWRPKHCCVGEDVWNQLLSESGFRSNYSFKAYANQLAFVTAVASDEDLLEQLPKVNDYQLERQIGKTWVIFAGRCHLEITSRLAKILNAVEGYQVVMVMRKGDEVISHEMGEGVTKHVISADNEDPIEVNSLLESEENREISGIIYAWGMDMDEHSQSMVAQPFLHVAKTLANQVKPPKLYILTQGLQDVDGSSTVWNPTAATLIGMAKSLKNENPHLFVRCIDVQRCSLASTIVDQVIYELSLSQRVKDQQRFMVAYKGNLVYEPKLTKIMVQPGSNQLKLPGGTERYHLVLPQSRSFQDLKFEHLEDNKMVGNNEIQVKVEAYALNFRDVFAVLKPTKEFENLTSVGLDFSGTVMAVGPSSLWKIGDRVFGANFKDNQLSSHLMLDSKTVLRIPASMTYWEAATLPAVFATAYHCLINIAKLKRGESVLIHTGSGGVGLVAIQVAKYVGANIISTAGNPRKRAYLKSLGIDHVFHSRDASFEKDIFRISNGRGVDVVLNSITGPGIKEATLNCTARNGRFVEMSKLSIWKPEEVNILRPDVDYSIVDLTTVDGKTWSGLLCCLEKFLRDGHLKPIPFTKFDAFNIRQALEHLQKAKHIGKVICTMPSVATENGHFQVTAPLFNDRSTYLITGGLGGIGFEVCKWMLKHGATNIVVNGRSPPLPEVASQIKKLNESGCNVTVELGDIGDFDQCKKLMENLRQTTKPIRGIMHCAGVLRDNLYPNQCWQAFQDTFKPKVMGTWNLHNLTIDLNLEHFVLYSSITALIGTPGQSTHVAANSFQDAFIKYRHSLGLTGTTINWGQWAQVGCAKEAYMSGFLPVGVKGMLKGLDMVLRTPKNQISFCNFGSFQNLSAVCPNLKSYLDERLWEQDDISSSQKTKGLEPEEFWVKMGNENTKEDKIHILSAVLKEIVQNCLRLDSTDAVQQDANIQELGIDSIMMIELRNSIQSIVGSRVSITAGLLKNCNTIGEIAKAVVCEMGNDFNGNQRPEIYESHLSKDLLQTLMADSTLNPEIKAAISPAVKPSMIHSVLVTGATGQLAKNIILNLCKSYNSVKRIVCLVKDKKKLGMDKFKDLLSFIDNVSIHKIEYLPGDVAMENMGLSQEMYRSLCNDIDAVIHCAVKTDYLEYREYILPILKIYILFFLLAFPTALVVMRYI